MKKIYVFIGFLCVNFGGLAIGNWFMGEAVTGNWYVTLNKAPWTPPGWVFGFAWTTIMICFSWFLTVITVHHKNTVLAYAFLIAWILNVSWNWFFFNQKMAGIGFLVLIALTFSIFYFFIAYKNKTKKWEILLLMPYLIWLCIATSLNGYILYHN